jgi:hypothetical protein
MIPRLLILSMLVLTACASPPPPISNPPEELLGSEDPVAADPIAKQPTTERGTLVAADDEETAAGEALERAAQDYQDHLERMFEKLGAELDGCYLPQLKRDPALAGTIAVTFTIVPGGGIGDGPRVSQSSLNNDKVEACVLDLIRAQSYPEPYNGKYATVLRTFRFGSF